MSDEADRPLTRRERRLREMAESGPVPTIPAAEEPREPAVPATQEPSAVAEEIEISPFNEDGTPRSRREIRLLREEALAARAAAAAGTSGAAASGAAAADELDPRLAETQPLTLDELRELQEEAQREMAAAEAAEAAAEAEAVMHAETVADVETVADLEIEVVEAEVVEPEPEREAHSEETAKAERSYSFPDIAPLDENVSVFDDPALRGPLPEAEPRGDFDDLISRAVAQEGAASATNTSALILPNLPDTGELSGPIGETGELFITGSIELPRSLGETGGHAPLHDSTGADSFEELGLDAIPTSGDPISPVAASRAVSAMSAAGPVVAQDTKEKSKLPLVLIITGGGLVIAVGALLIWGASAGMFG